MYVYISMFTYIYIYIYIHIVYVFMGLKDCGKGLVAGALRLVGGRGGLGGGVWARGTALTRRSTCF